MAGAGTIALARLSGLALIQVWEARF